MPVFGVQIQHDTPGQQGGIQIQGSAQASFLIDSEQQFQRWVAQTGIGHQRQGRRTAHPVIGTQCGAIRPQPTVLNSQTQRVGAKIVGLVGSFHCHHVEVILHDDGGTLLHTLAGGNRDHQITCLIHTPAVPALGSEINNVLANGLLLSGGPRNLGNPVEVLPQVGRLGGIVVRYHPWSPGKQGRL